MMRAESDKIASSDAGDDTGRIVISVGVCSRTGLLKKLRVRRRLALLRAAKVAGATVPRGSKSRASAFASHYLVVASTSNLQSTRAYVIQISDTSGVPTFPTLPLKGLDRDSEVVPVDETHVVEILGA